MWRQYHSYPLFLDTALTFWDDEQRLEGDRLVALAQRMGEALQDGTRDWGRMNERDMSRWWETVIKDQRWYATAAICRDGIADS